MMMILVTVEMMPLVAMVMVILRSEVFGDGRGVSDARSDIIASIPAMSTHGDGDG